MGICLQIIGLPFSSVKDPVALFTNIPEDPLLTMGFEVPPAWVVVSKESIHDLDNIVLSKLSSASRGTGLTATYELKNILIDGHARDVTHGNSPPSGMQIVLGTEQNPHVVDTIVMANLGYLQLKANPGVWTLDLKDGRSKDIFALQSVGSEGWSSRDVETIGTDIVLTSFEGITIYPRVVRREGKELANVLEAEESSGFVNQAEKFVGKWKNKFMGGTKEVVKSGPNQAEINIFSVASGHLYERFIYIMIQSVLNHTNSTVKFWFIENFLSPSFKANNPCSLSDIRPLFRCLLKSLDSIMSSLRINGLTGFVDREKSNGRSGDTRSYSWTYCFPSISTKLSS